MAFSIICTHYRGDPDGGSGLVINPLMIVMRYGLFETTTPGRPATHFQLRDCHCFRRDRRGGSTV
jgi:hypothetical protein